VCSLWGNEEPQIQSDDCLGLHRGFAEASQGRSAVAMAGMFPTNWKFVVTLKCVFVTTTMAR
jgi:hypothetical protein